MPVCSDISDADDELLILTAEKMEKGSDYSTQARNNDETSTTSQNSLQPPKVGFINQNLTKILPDFSQNSKYVD
jgi:hypothetical protein